MRHIIIIVLAALVLGSCKKDSSISPYHFDFSVDGKQYTIDSLLASVSVVNGQSNFQIKGGTSDPFLSINVRGNSFKDTNFIRTYFDLMLPDPTAYVFFGFVVGTPSDPLYGVSTAENGGEFYFTIEEKNDSYIAGTFKGSLHVYSAGWPSNYLRSIQIVNGKFKVPYHY